MPYTTVREGDPITPEWANENVRDQAITPFATMSALLAAITSPVEGMLAYLEDSDTYVTCNGSAWRYILGPPGVSKPDNETITNDSTLQNDDDLAIPVGANATYRGELHASFTANASAGLKCDFTAPAGATIEASSFLTVVSGITVVDPTSALGSIIGITGIGSPVPLHLWFTLVTSGTAGTLQWRWAQNASHASDATVHKGSSLTLARIA